MRRRGRWSKPIRGAQDGRRIGSPDWAVAAERRMAGRWLPRTEPGRNPEKINARPAERLSVALPIPDACKKSDRWLIRNPKADPSIGDLRTDASDDTSPPRPPSK